MPLYDLFHPPLSTTHHWEAFHNRWSVAIADDLNRRLPRRFLAEAPMHLGPHAAADVAEVDSDDQTDYPDGHSGNGTAVALAVETYAPPTAIATMPASFPLQYRVEVRDVLRASRVLAVVELVSPGNKDTREHRQAFAGKCLSYLEKGIGLVVLDSVAGRRANLHNAIVQLAGHGAEFEMVDDPPTYAAAYRPVTRGTDDLIDLWHWPLTLGIALPAVPLALKGYGCIRLDLEATYAEACERSRIP